MGRQRWSRAASAWAPAVPPVTQVRQPRGVTAKARQVALQEAADEIEEITSEADQEVIIEEFLRCLGPGAARYRRVRRE